MAKIILGHCSNFGYDYVRDIRDMLSGVRSLRVSKEERPWKEALEKLLTNALVQVGDRAADFPNTFIASEITIQDRATALIFLARVNPKYLDDLAATKGELFKLVADMRRLNPSGINRFELFRDVFNDHLDRLASKREGLFKQQWDKLAGDTLSLLVAYDEQFRVAARADIRASCVRFLEIVEHRPARALDAKVKSWLTDFHVNADIRKAALRVWVQGKGGDEIFKMREQLSAPEDVELAEWLLGYVAKSGFVAPK